MDFMLEPMELGTELETLSRAPVKVTCEVGYGCDTGTVEQN